MKVSDCCGVPAYSNGDSDTEDIGICPECRDHCEYVEEEEEEAPVDERGEEIVELKKEIERLRKVLGEVLDVAHKQAGCKACIAELEKLDKIK